MSVLLSLLWQNWQFRASPIPSASEVVLQDMGEIGWRINTAAQNEARRVYIS